MHTETAVPTSPACYAKPGLFDRLGRKGWVSLGGGTLALLAAGFAWQWSWLVAVGIVPLLVSAVPCLAMCALGLCMSRMAEGGIAT